MSSPFVARRAAAAEPPLEDPAPRDRVHDGLHVSTIGGGGFTSFAEQGAHGRVGAVGYGPATTLLVGATPWRGVIVGGGVDASSPLGYVEDGARISADIATAGPFVEWYPAPETGWHFGALAGAGVVRLRTAAISETSGVLGVTAIAGYGWWLSPDWSLGITARATASTEGGSLDAPSSGARYQIAPLSAGLEVELAFH